MKGNKTSRSKKPKKKKKKIYGERIPCRNFL